MKHEPDDWLRGVLSSIGDAVITTDTEGRITFLNSVGESLTGWTPQEAAGRPLEDVFRIVNEETGQPVASPTLRALQEGRIVGLANHTVLIAKDGTERLIDDSAAPIRGAKGEVAGVVLVFRDNTERREGERALQRALAYADDIIATLREPFVVLDSDLRIRTANHSFYELFRVSEEETESHLLYDLGGGQWDIPALRKLLAEVLSKNKPLNDFEVEHAFPLLGRRIMALNARPFPLDSEEPEFILLAIEDLTHRRETANRLAVSELRYRRLFESAKDGILILDAETGRIEDANPFMNQLLGYSHDQLVGKELWEIGLFRDIAESKAAVEQLQETSYMRYEDLPLRSLSGETREVEFISNVYGENGRRVIQCNIRDVTERKRMERHIMDQARSLADTNRRKDEFLAMLSHELRNPLAPISSALQLLGQGSAETDLHREARAIMERQVHHMTRLVDDLLEVSRITTGGIRLHTERVDIRAIVEMAVERVSPHIDRRSQGLTLKLPDEVVWLEADALRLEQVVGNLLSNASVHSGTGSHITLTVEPEDQHAVIRVRDDGIGIAPGLLPRIFDLFTQASQSLARTEGGLGIGLALVKSLVDLHHGSVEAHSEGLGLGSEFVVRLPVASAPARTEPAFVAAQPELAIGRSLRVLVVEDNLDAAMMSALLLRSWGHEVRTAHSGPEALQRVVGFHPHVVLMDIGLPDMDGYEVARHIRLNPQLEGVRLVAVTGYGQATDRELAMEAGFDDHMVKPVALEDLRKQLNKAQQPPA